MQIIDNINHTVKADLQKQIQSGSKMSVAAACFSIYAYQELKKQLEGIDELRFIFTSPTFVTEKASKAQREFYIPRISRESSLYGTEFEVKLRNELTQKAIAKECADWIRRKAVFKSNVTQEQMMGFMTVDESTYMPINGFTTVDLGCERGIDGFRMDVITMISKDQRFPDGVVHGNEKFGDFSPYVNNGPRVHEYLKEMNEKVISRFDWMTVGEGAGAGVEDAKRYAGTNENELDMIFTFEHVNLGQTQYGKWSDGSFDLVELKKVFQKWEDGLEGVAWNSLYWDNHDQPRAVSRFGNDSEEYREISAKMLATCLHFMKGTPYIYQGEELGMTNRKCRDFSEFRDIEIKNAYRDFVGGGILDEETMLKFVNAIGRDNARFPMHWDDSDNAGFTTGTPWISVNENYKKINAAAQVNDPDSIFSYYKKLIELRHQMEIIVYGVYKSKAIEHPDVFAYTRTLGEEKLFVVCNFREQEMDFTLEDGFTGDEKVLISNYDDVVKTENGIYLRPYEAKVFYRK